MVETTAVLTYDRQELLYLHLPNTDGCRSIPVEDHIFNSWMSSTFPVVTCCSTSCYFHRKKCLRKQGKCSGLLAMLSIRFLFLALLALCPLFLVIWEYVHPYAKNLDVFFFYSKLNFAKQVNTVVKTSFYYLR